jgi:hypothetical protein
MIKFGPLIAIYFLMVVFDLSVLAGTVWLIAERDWSTWWMLFATFMCAGSNPKNMIRVWRGEPEQKGGV